MFWWGGKFIFAITSLSLRERVGVRGSNAGRCLGLYALILSFSRGEKGRPVWVQER